MFGNKAQQKQYHIFSSFFYFFAALAAISFVIEIIEPGFVTNWYNPLWFLLGSIVSGIVARHNKK